MTDTTTMTRATHKATAATAINGINLLVRYRIVSLLWYTGCASYSFHPSSVLFLEHRLSNSRSCKNKHVELTPSNGG
ncbi:MAG: hypothetical protein MK073_03550 [Phycisphaerales bacterium]|nr:hypothetical protein [Phycisphaerales bacterium]